MHLKSKQVLNDMPTWWAPLVNWAAAFAVRGPKWMPIAVRRLPLFACCEFMKAKVRQLLDDRGEGPRSGGGKATSGAGAQRKEGVQPPGDSAAVVEVNA
jgi:hypothetical protein